MKRKKVLFDFKSEPALTLDTLLAQIGMTRDDLICVRTKEGDLFIPKDPDKWGRAPGITGII